MPSATKELQDKWGDDSNAIQFLEAAGFVLNREFDWTAPKPISEMTKEEWSAVMYLITEWDYGGVRQ